MVVLLSCRLDLGARPALVDVPARCRLACHCAFGATASRWAQSKPPLPVQMPLALGPSSPPSLLHAPPGATHSEPSVPPVQVSLHGRFACGQTAQLRRASPEHRVYAALAAPRAPAALLLSRAPQGATAPSHAPPSAAPWPQPAGAGRPGARPRRTRHPPAPCR
jgi:hypothetical protein